jgi:hypothetical protein
VYPLFTRDNDDDDTNNTNELLVTRTAPPVKAPSTGDRDVLLGNSFAAFSFRRTPASLDADFAANPLVVELRCRGGGGGDVDGDASVGVMRVDLTALLNAPQHSLYAEAPPANASSSSTSSQSVPHPAPHVVDEHFAVVGGVGGAGGDDSTAGAAAVAEVWCVLSLEDFGVPPPRAHINDGDGDAAAVATDGASASQQSLHHHHPPHAHAHAHHTGSPQGHRHHHHHPQHTHGGGGVAHARHAHAAHGSPPNGGGNSQTHRDRVRNSHEYQVAWELEMWRKQEMAAQRERWSASEASRMAELEGEWKAQVGLHARFNAHAYTCFHTRNQIFNFIDVSTIYQEVARETALARRKQTLAKLEKKLKDTLFDLERQERRLRLGEDEVVAARAALQVELKQVGNAS